MGPELPFSVPLSIGIFPEGSENGRILGPAFWCWRTTCELIFGIAQSGRGATISSATCSWRTPKLAMLAENTSSFQTIKLLHSYQAQRQQGRPLGVQATRKALWACECFGVACKQLRSGLRAIKKALCGPASS